MFDRRRHGRVTVLVEDRHAMAALGKGKSRSKAGDTGANDGNAHDTAPNFIASLMQ